MSRRDNDRNPALAWTMLGLAGVLLPFRPRAAITLATRQPAATELRLAAAALRIALWPEVGFLAVGVVSGFGIAIAGTELEYRLRRSRLAAVSVDIAQPEQSAHTKQPDRV